MEKISDIVSSPLIYLIIAWSVYWKGRALWKSARKDRKGWFIAILILNTLGLLEIVYLYILDKDRSALEETRSEASQ